MGLLDTLGQQFGFGGPPATPGVGAGGPTPTLQQPQQQGLTPSQIASLREYVKALQHQNAEPIGTVAPKAAPLAGLAKGAEGLITGMLAGQAGQAERQGALNAADTLDAGTDTGTPGQSSSASPSSASSGPPIGNTPMERALNHTAMNETSYPFSKESASNDSPDAFHSTSSGSLGLNTHYGSRPSDWGTWSPEKRMAYEREYFGKIYNAAPGQLQAAGFAPEISRDPGVQAYLADRTIQMGNTGQVGAYNAARGAKTPQEFINRVSQYDKSTLGDHFHTYLSENPGNVQGLKNRIDKRSQFALGESGGGGGAAPSGALAFNGPASEAPTARSTANVVAGTNQPPQNSPLSNPQQMAQAVGGGQSPNGGAIPDYQGMVRHKAAQLLRSGQYGYGPGATHSAIADATALVEGSIKYQPQRVEDEHGNVYMKSPNGSIQMLHEGSGKVSGVDDGSGLKQFVLENKHPVTGVMKRTPSDPYGNPVGPSTTIGPGGQVVKSSASPSPQGATGAPPAAQGGAGTGGALGTAPPASPQLPSGPIAPGDAPKSIAKYAAVPNPVEAFHLPPKPDFNATPEERRAYGENIKSIGEAHTDDLKKETERYRKNADSLEKNGQIARTAIPQLKMLLQIMDDPKMYSGFLTKEASTISQIKTLFKLGDGKAGEDKMADLQAFAKKLGSTANLADIDERTGEGAGTAKIPTLNQITQSNYDSTNPKPSNRAVTELHLRQMERYNELADFARQFKRNAGGRLNQNFDQFVADYYKDKPFISDQEGYDKLLSGARNQEQPAAASNPITDAIAAERARRKHLNPPVQVPQSR